jgi:hypothetical protein
MNRFEEGEKFLAQKHIEREFLVLSYSKRLVRSPGNRWENFRSDI